jgi:hypothetical protein
MRLALLFLFLTFCLGSIDELTLFVDRTDQFKLIWEFEFAKGGNLDAIIALTSAVTMRNRSIQILLFDDANIRDLNSRGYNNWDAICKNEVFDRVKSVNQMNLGLGFAFSGEWHYVADSSEWLHLYFLNCHNETYTLKVTVVAQNPGGEYLSLSDTPNETLYAVCTAIWFVISTVWTMNWFLYRHFNVSLQRMMTLVPLCLLLISIFSLINWREVSRTGKATKGLGYVSRLLECITIGVVSLILMLTAQGWQITKTHLDRVDRRRLIVMVTLLSVSQETYKLVGGLLLFFLVLVYILVFRYMFTSIAAICALLANQQSILRSTVGVNLRTTPAWTKLQMMKRFQGILVKHEKRYNIYCFVLLATVCATTSERGGKEIRPSFTNCSPLGFVNHGVCHFSHMESDIHEIDGMGSLLVFLSSVALKDCRAGQRCGWKCYSHWSCGDHVRDIPATSFYSELLPTDR